MPASISSQPEKRSSENPSALPSGVPVSMRVAFMSLPSGDMRSRPFLETGIRGRGMGMAKVSGLYLICTIPTGFERPGTKSHQWQ